MAGAKTLLILCNIIELTLVLSIIKHVYVLSPQNSFFRYMIYGIIIYLNMGHSVPE